MSLVAPSFEDWYASWLDAAVRNRGPWLHWDSRCCATYNMLGQVLEDRRSRGEPLDDLGGDFATGAIRLTVGAGFLPAGSAGDPCHGCVELATRFGLPREVFAPGVLLD